jgi:hypothetical protein
MTMIQHNPSLFCLLIVFVGSTWPSPESIDNVTKQNRSTTNLEYVMRVLEEQGRLGEVDGELLSRIQSTINKNKWQGEIKRRSKQTLGLNQVASSPRESVLNFARTRQKQRFGACSQNRLPLQEPKRSSEFSEIKQVVGGECQAIKTENKLGLSCAKLWYKLTWWLCSFYS